MPSSAVRAFTDSDAYFAGIRNLQIDAVVTRRGQFRAESTRIDLHRLWMHRFEEVLPRIMRITPSGQRSVILFATDPAQPVMQVNGMETCKDQIAHFTLDQPYYLRSSAACQWGAMSLCPEDLAIASETITGRVFLPPSFPRRITPRADAMSRLLRLHNAAGQLASATPDILAKSEVAKAIEQALIEAMVSCLAEDVSDDVRTVHRQRAKVMQRLEEVLKINLGKPLYMPELCTAVGASYTTLRDCCQAYLGMSPKRYLWLRRMHLARRALLKAEPGGTVTAIATDYGFWELGRFAVAYRSLFGELPSAALRRPPEAQNGSRIAVPI